LFVCFVFYIFINQYNVLAKSAISQINVLLNVYCIPKKRVNNSIICPFTLHGQVRGVKFSASCCAFSALYYMLLILL